ncbi:DCP2-domain-containing protein [Phlebopus sp. FC_14]|nr:DCP2-domain-containing protein [Phlebopus sp. FC_14]
MTSSSSSSPEIQPAPAAASTERFTYKHATHEDVLEDLSSRFLLNLPDEELSSLERICFQVEQAHWFYEDFVREQNPKFPSLPLKKFSEMLFHACPLLHQWSHDHEQAFNTFMQYKTRVPVCGAIMLNESWEKCILVKGWKSSSGWGFPKGKINEHEPPHECAIREVLEETGYNLAAQINPADVIEMSIKEQLISLFIVPGVPDDFPFKTRTRKEISRIEWFKLTDLPTWKRNRASPGKFYLISPFIAALKAFITARKPRALDARGRKVTPYVDGSRGAQESSSSSADNGEPQTPSPQYSEAVPANSGIVAREAVDDKIESTESMDPHFARLLNSLSLSAAKAVDHKTNSQSSLSQLGHKASDNATARSTKSSPSNCMRTLDWSTRAADYALEVSQSPTPAKLSAVIHELPKPAHLVGSTSVSGASKLPSFPPFGIPTDSSPPLSAAHPLTSLLTASSSGSLGPLRKHALSSRRSSSTADISPYLSRPTEVPASGKRLKQLALLETVVDESSKMTPTLINRELPAPWNPDSSMAGHPGPLASVAPATSWSGVDTRPSYGPVLSTSRSLHVSQARPRSSQFGHYDTTYSAGPPVDNFEHQISHLAGRRSSSSVGLSGVADPSSLTRPIAAEYPFTAFHSSGSTHTETPGHPPTSSLQQITSTSAHPGSHPFVYASHPSGMQTSLLPSTLPRSPHPSSAQLLSILNSRNEAGTRALPTTTEFSTHAY